MKNLTQTQKENLKSALFFGTIVLLIITIHLLTPLQYR